MARKARKYRASFENKMEDVGQKFSKKFEKHFEKINYWYEGLSIVGPIIYSILRTIGFVIIVWIEIADRLRLSRPLPPPGV